MKFNLFITGSLLATGLSASTFVASAQAQTVAQQWQAGWAQYEALNSEPASVSGLSTQTTSFYTDFNAPIELVFEVYANVNNALGRHTFLTQIEPVSDTWDCLVLTRDFIAIEVVPYEGQNLTLSTISQQRIHHAEFYYDADSYDVPGVLTHQHITFTLQPHGVTRVTENLTFQAPAAELDFTVEGGVEAHQAVATSLKTSIEAGEFSSPQVPGVSAPRWSLTARSR
jgi:hypothetical protein